MSKKTYKGNLDINKKTISIETDYAFQAIQIDYVVTLKIESLLPNNYVVVNKRIKHVQTDLCITSSIGPTKETYLK